MAQVIARTPDTPANLHSSGDLIIPVKCAHKDGIEEVVFTLTDSDTNTLQKTITQQATCTKYDNKLWCHFATFTEAELATLVDGVVDVSALCKPGVAAGNTNREVTWTFYNNVGGFLIQIEKYINSVDGNDTTGDGSRGDPYATIAKAYDVIKNTEKYTGGGGDDRTDGGIVYLMEKDAGGKTSYAYGGGNNKTAFDTWCTIQRDPLATMDSVVIDSNPGSPWYFECGYLRFKDLWFDQINFSNSGPVSGSNIICVDSCQVNGAGWDQDLLLINITWWPDGIYIVNTLISDIVNSFNVGNLSRDCTVTRIGSNACQNFPAVFNLTVEDVDKAGVSHPDVVQLPSSQPSSNNNVVCGVIAWDAIGAQGQYCSGPRSDLLLENILMDNAGNSWLTDDLENYTVVPHVLMVHCSFLDGNNWQTAGSSWTFAGESAAKADADSRMINCIFHSLGNPAGGNYDGTIEDCHFLGGTNRGSDPTSDTEAATLTNYAGQDYRVKSSSTAYSSGQAITEYNLPPGPQGVGDPSSPTKGAYGDAASGAFSGGLYSAGEGGSAARRMMAYGVVYPLDEL